MLPPLLNDLSFHFGSPGGAQRTSFSLPETLVPTFWLPRRHHDAHRDPKAPKLEPEDSPDCAKMTSKPPKTDPKSASKTDPEYGNQRVWLQTTVSALRPFRIVRFSKVLWHSTPAFLNLPGPNRRVNLTTRGWKPNVEYSCSGTVAASRAAPMDSCTNC